MARSNLRRRSAADVFAAVALLLLAVTGNLRAQAPEGPDTTESTTEDTTGIVTGISGFYTITVKDRQGPFTYRQGTDMHIFGPHNRALKITEVELGDEVTVYYYFRDNHPTVARLVVLRRVKPPGRK